MQVLWVFSHGSPVFAIDWGKRSIVAVDMRGRVHVWSDTGSQKKTEFPTAVVNPKVVRLWRSGSRLAIGGSAVAVYTLAGTRVHYYKNSSSTNDLVWLPDGRILAAQNKGILLLNPADGKAVEVKNPRGCAFTAIASSPDGKRFATGTCDGFVDVWFADTLVPYRTLKFNSPIADLFWSKDGRTLAVATDEGIYLYSTAGWEPTDSILRGTYGVRFVSLSYDGRFVAYGGKDEVPRLYDRKRRVIYEGQPFFHWITAGDWEEAGFRFVMVDADGHARVMKVRREALR